MLTKYILKLDEKGWPQRFVRWASLRRSQSQLADYLFPKSSGTHAVTLTVATPLISHKDLFEGAVPTQFGSWREFKVQRTSEQGLIAVAMLKDPRSDTEFALIVPIHADLLTGGFDMQRSYALPAKRSVQGW